VGTLDAASVAQWRSNLGLLDPSVGLIETLEVDPQGSGFLVGPDLMITEAHVLNRFGVDPKRVPIRAQFDSRSPLSSAATPVDLADDWLVAISREPEMDFAIPRLRTSVTRPISGSNWFLSSDN
jgi:hypothetical protein